MVRLVKGAYWDTEIKRAQVLGLSDYPVFTRKVNTDISYLACARKLLAMTDRIYPQFATHNAHSVAAVLKLAGDQHDYEFQRLHGMGESLHEHVHSKHDARCRIYAPVGEHQDLLAYLVRRLLENGANSSFVNQIVDTSISPESIARDPIDILSELEHLSNPSIPMPPDLYGSTKTWQAKPLTAASIMHTTSRNVFNPADPEDRVGEVFEAELDTVEQAIQSAAEGSAEWALCNV
jgi:RHH-type proline utilization regulon transcriptional repressor/proline dehydrogenase/delta 1-pyrroline-5-carboxylate dehydrogenase